MVSDANRTASKQLRRVNARRLYWQIQACAGKLAIVLWNKICHSLNYKAIRLGLSVSMAYSPDLTQTRPLGTAAFAHGPAGEIAGGAAPGTSGPLATCGFGRDQHNPGVDVGARGYRTEERAFTDSGRASPACFQSAAASRGILQAFPKSRVRGDSYSSDIDPGHRAGSLFASVIHASCISAAQGR